jgi:uncharacterized membrane protein
MSAEDAGGGGTLPFGPIQMLVVEFDRTRFDGEIMPEFDRLKRAGLIRLVDLLFVTKNDDGELDVLKTTDLNRDEAMEFGAIVGALVGLGMAGEEGAEAGAMVGAEAGEDGHVIDESQVWYLEDRIPPGSSAAVVLIEHLWAIPLRDKMVASGGVALADEWIHPADLVALGLVAALSEAESVKT